MSDLITFAEYRTRLGAALKRKDDLLAMRTDAVTEEVHLALADVEKAMDRCARDLLVPVPELILTDDEMAIVKAMSSSRSAALAGAGLSPPSPAPAQPHHSTTQPRAHDGSFHTGLFRSATPRRTTFGGSFFE